VEVMNEVKINANGRDETFDGRDRRVYGRDRRFDTTLNQRLNEALYRTTQTRTEYASLVGSSCGHAARV
jgi:hypothetical protein